MTSISLENVRELLQEFMGISPKKIKATSKLYENLGIESADMLGMIVTIEKRYEIKFDDSVWWEIKTVQDIINTVNNYIQTK